MADQEQRGAPHGHSVELGRLNGNLGFRLRRVHQQLSRRYAEQTRAFGFRSGGISPLAIIEANPGVSQISVAREIDVDASIAVGLPNDMRRRGLVTRTRLSDDRRRYAITITDAGRLLLDKIMAGVSAMEDELLHYLTPHGTAVLWPPVGQGTSSACRRALTGRRHG
jgi:DNA-binding MarR family transcriptional regulator